MLLKNEVALTLSDKTVLFKGKITLLPIIDELLIQKSIEIFGDAEPCFIHKSAVMKVFYVEIEEFLISALTDKRNILVFNEIPANFQMILKGIYPTPEDIAINIIT